ncbi:hypothetical protein RFI_10625 [Reticulomyxa filosa]|uniref:Uncharacterized protein n=1 Tax=Reticulomyxa filosa TaxID=46433 RepID=X6NMA0_RETFI|nr:hypothetical protein RFI_10625 [Reticulomyxa filosa]|eukprot:ETO26512.1 hypothetical protein RFI_10625 [Reticulomyxa filosa]
MLDFFCSIGENTKWFLEIIGSGVLVVSTLGLYLIRHTIWRARFVFVVTLAQDVKVLRIFLCVGIAHSFYSLFDLVGQFVKYYLFKFGEQILDVS